MVEGGGSVIAAFFLAHNYVSEQFGNYVEYGTLFPTRSIIIQGPYSDPIIFLPSRCYTEAGWHLDQTKGDRGTVRWSLNCQLMGHASTG